LNMME